MAFSVKRSQAGAAVRYMWNQAGHHRKTTFEEEFVAILKRHGVEFDRRYVFG